MPILNGHQLQSLISSLKPYVYGAQLQDIALNQNYLLLQHHLKGSITIGFELRPLMPRLGYFFGDIPKSKYLVKPIVLFLRAHARNLRLSDIFVDQELGRVIRLVYSSSDDRSCHLELRLFPHGVNVIIKAQEKSISLFPVKVLPPSLPPSESREDSFDVELYLDDWMNSFLGKVNKASPAHLVEDPDKKRKKEIHKKEILIEKLTQDLSTMNKPWYQLGEYLKTNRTLDVPEEWLSLIDPHHSVSVNMQMCFEKYKKQELRVEQIKERINYIQSEIQHLQQVNESSANGSSHLNPNLAPSVRSLAGELLSKAKAKGRKLKLAEDIEAAFGKSAKDNLAILRKAQSWDLWLHLRDMPGSHLIIRRPKNKSVDQHLLFEAARWLLNETLGKKKIITGDRYDIIVTECRYVKPIRGDRLGRVSYQNEMTLTLRV